MFGFDIQAILKNIPPFLFALTVHEFAHGWAADRLGDPTARQAGRLTLNPMAHLDPFGSIMIFIVGIGWAKPVPVNPYNFQSPKRDMMLVALAGPVSNIILATGCAVLLQVVGMPRTTGGLGLMQTILLQSVRINLILAAFNMFPIPPLDGSKVLMGLLPDSLSEPYRGLERFGMMPFLLVWIADGYLGFRILWSFINPIVYFFSSLMLGSGFLMR